METLTLNGYTAVPYCGVAPLPTELLSRWNLDPWLIAALIVFAAYGMSRTRHDGRARTALGVALALLIVVFISPLCALASALFSARVAHHVLLIAAVAPLLALAMSARRPLGHTTLTLSLTPIALVHAIILWIWHIPAPYRFALSSDVGYWLMQVSLLGSAYALWRAVLSPATASGAAILALLGTLFQMGLLGALLVFAPRALFTPHLGVTLPFGLTELQDQQLAGLLMWVPAMLPYLFVALVTSARWIRSSAPAT